LRKLRKPESYQWLFSVESFTKRVCRPSFEGSTRVTEPVMRLVRGAVAGRFAIPVAALTVTEASHFLSPCVGATPLTVRFATSAPCPRSSKGCRQHRSSTVPQHSFFPLFDTHTTTTSAPHKSLCATAGPMGHGAPGSISEQGSLAASSSIRLPDAKFPTHQGHQSSLSGACDSGSSTALPSPMDGSHRSPR